MAHKIFLFSFFILSFFFSCCNSIEPPPPEKTITLTLEDVSCIEAWVNITTTNLQLPTTITIKQNNQTLKTISLEKADTLLYIDSLLPNVNYTFQVSSIQHQVSSNELSVTTLDTTSHSFNFETWTFGEHSSSVLYDVAIIDENNIWAVGEIYMNDSLGQPDPHAYNAVHWDGNEWKFLRIMFYAICGQQTTTPYPASAVFAFNENEVWIAMDGDQVARMDGITQIETHCMPISFSINKIWGTSSENLFAVGDNGTIVKYNGTNWGRMGSVTESNVNDIWGIIDIDTGEEFILAAVSNVASSGDIKLLQIKNNSIRNYPWVQDRWVVSIWFNNRYKLFASGSGVHISNKYGEWIKQESLPPKFSESISGEANNDVFVVGDFSLVSHYNGMNWKVYDEIPVGRYISNSYKNGIMVATGDVGSKAIILTMKR